MDSIWKRMHGFILNRGLSPVFILMKQAKKNSFKMLTSGLLCVCAIFRINHVAKTISLLASRMPVRSEVFLQFSFSNKVFMFLLHYTCSVLRSRNSRKAFKFLSKRLVLLLYGNQYRNLCFVHKTTYLWSMRSPRGGELSLSACLGVGNRPPSENKIANPRGYARGGDGKR